MKKLRNEISDIDREIIELISKRLALAEKIAKEKEKQGIGLIDATRELEVLSSVGKKASELGLDEEVLKKVFVDVINLSRNKQIRQLSRTRPSDAKLKIAFQGEPGAYSELAIRKNFPKAEARPCNQFNDVFDTLENNSADCALVPVENSTEGSVNQVYDLLLERETAAIAEVFLRVEHMLIANHKAEKIANVYSHPQALDQCRGYLLRNKLKPISFYDTAGAVKMLREKGILDSAAIASETAAGTYGMKILERGIEDNTNNFTRFLLIARKDNADRISKLINAGGKYKTSMIFGLPHVPGSLYDVLGEIAKNRINLTKIESRPTKRTPWEYTFYVDFEGSVNDDKVKSMLENLKGKTTFMKIIGSYRMVD